ncbi:Holliday junction ATP-dependent DNA helicase RuvB [uncultured archaeon]|nr:Holliday junction ATP-dependent DNA helicase RuvB [uncultured archaeon]
MPLQRDKDVTQQFRQLYDEVHKRVIGQEEVIQLLINAIFTGGHILLESVPGLGKTVVTKAVSDTMEMKFTRVQCTPDVTASDLMGRVDWNPEKKEYEIIRGAVFTNLLLMDEINRAQPKTQSAMLEAMEEMQVTLGGQSYPLPQPFTVLATQNPVEQSGTNPLPEAQADRFLYKVTVNYLTAEQEVQMLKAKKKTSEPLKKIFNPAEVLIIRDEIKNNVTVSDDILDYIVRIVNGTRTRREVQTGGSPRATVALFKGGQTKAFLEGRDYVTVKDIQELAFPILRHRIILNPDSRDFGVTTDDIIAKVLEHTEAPVQ